MRLHSTCIVVVTGAIMIAACGPHDTAAPLTADCEVTGATLASDSSAAIAACERARDRFAQLFAGTVPRVRIALHDRPGMNLARVDSGIVVQFPSTKGLEIQAAAVLGEPTESARRAHVRDGWEWVLPHEIGHALLGRRFLPDEAPDSSRYGTRFPDWLDEGVAVWMEPQPVIDNRLDQARDSHYAIALADFLAAVHPSLGKLEHGSTTELKVTTSNCSAPAGSDFCKDFVPMSVRRRIDGNGVVSVDTLTGDALERDTAEGAAVTAFYAASAGFMTFLMERTGQAGVTRLAEHFADGQSGAWPELPGLPRDAVALDTAWRKWLGTR